MSWMSLLSWKEGLSPSALKEIDKLELEVERLHKEKSIKSLQFETLEAALEKKSRKIEDEKSLAAGLQRDLQDLNEQVHDLRTKVEKKSTDVSFKESQLASLQGNLECKNRALEAVQSRVRSLEESLELSTSKNSSGFGSCSSPGNALSPGGGSKFKGLLDSNSSGTVEDIRFKLDNATEIIRKKDQIIEELREQREISVSTLDLFNSPKAFAQRNRSSSIVFFEENKNESMVSPSKESSEDAVDTPNMSQDALQEALSKISELEARINDYECKLYNAESIRVSLEKQLGEDEKRKSMNGFEGVEPINAKLLEECTSHHRLEEENRALINEKSVIQKELQNLREESKTELEDLKKFYEHQLADGAKELSDQKTSCSELKENLSALSGMMEAAKKEARNSMDSKEEEILSLKAKLEEATEETIKQSNALKEEMESLKKDILEERERKLSEMDSLWKDKAEEMESHLGAQLKDLSDTLDKKEGDVLALSSQVSELTSQRDALSSQLRDLEVSLAMDSQNLLAKENNMKSEVEALSKSLKEAKDQMESKDSLSQGLTDENIALKDEVHRLKTESLSYESQRRCLSEELSLLKENTVPGLEESIRKAEERITALLSCEKVEKPHDSFLYQSLQSELSAALESLEQKKSQLSDLESRLSVLTEALEDEKKDKVDLSETLNDKVRDMLILQENTNLQILTLEEDKCELEKRIETIYEARDSLLEARDVLQTKNESLINSLSDLEARLHREDQEKSSLIEKVSEISKGSESLRTENEKLLFDVEKLEAEREKNLLNVDSLKDELLLRNEEFDEKVGELSSKVSALEESLEVKENQLFEAKDALDSLSQSHKDQLLDLKANHDTKVKDLETQVMSLNQALEALDKEKKGYISKIDALREESSSVADSIQKSNSQLLELRSEYENSLHEAAVEKASLTDIISDLKSKYESLTCEHEALTTEVDSLKPLREEVTQGQRYLAYKEAILQETYNKIKLLESESHKCSVRISELDEVSHGLERKLKDSCEELSAAKILNEDMSRENEELSQQMLVFESKYDALDEEVSELKDQKEALKKDLEEQKEEMALQLEEVTRCFEAEKSSLRTSLLDAERGVKDSKAQVASLERDKDKLLLDLEDSSGSLCTVQSSLDAAMNSIKSLEGQLAGKTAESEDLAAERESLRKQVLDSDSAIASLISKEKELLSSADEFQRKLSSLSELAEENDSLRKGLANLKESAEGLKSNIEALGAEKEELQKCHDKTLSDMNATHAKEKEKIMDKLRSLEASKEDDSRSWKSKVKSLLDNLKRKEKDITSLQSQVEALRASLEEQETSSFPWEDGSTEDYKGLSPLDLLCIFKDDQDLSHKARCSLYSGACAQLQNDLEAKMDRNIQLVKELGASKTEIDKLKFKYEELPKMNSKVNAPTRSLAKRKGSDEPAAENLSPNRMLKTDGSGLSNPFKKRSLLKPATLKMTNASTSATHVGGPLRSITNQTISNNTRSSSK